MEYLTWREWERERKSEKKQHVSMQNKRKRHRDDNRRKRELNLKSQNSLSSINSALFSLLILTNRSTDISIHLFCTRPLFIYFIKYQHTYNMKAQITYSVLLFVSIYLFSSFAFFQMESYSHLFIIKPVFGSLLHFHLTLVVWCFFFALSFGCCANQAMNSVWVCVIRNGNFRTSKSKQKSEIRAWLLAKNIRYFFLCKVLLRAHQCVCKALI